MDTGIAGYRKVISTVVMGLIIYGLNYFDLTADGLAAMGLHVYDVQEAIVELVMQIAVPAVINAAQPNAKGESLIRDWWHWVAIGFSGIAVVIAFIAWW